VIAAAACLIIATWIWWGRESRDFNELEVLFTGLALAGVVGSIYYQSRELAAQREELALTRSEVEGQRRALEAQVEESRAQAVALRAQADELHRQGELHQRQVDVGLLAAYLNASNLRIQVQPMEVEAANHALTGEAMGAVHRTQRRLNEEIDGERKDG